MNTTETLTHIGNCSPPEIAIIQVVPFGKVTSSSPKVFSLLPKVNFLSFTMQSLLHMEIILLWPLWSDSAMI